MNKAKRKGQPLNLKRYWIGYTLLAIILLIPFRVINAPITTLITYTILSVLIGLHALKVEEFQRAKTKMVNHSVL
ncbi:MAG: hypothetical protein AAF846_06915 [Chloroflexota bacterium]